MEDMGIPIPVRIKAALNIQALAANHGRRQ
jgi:hypothetical protein